MNLDTETLLKEFTYKATTSGGPGGQHANKVSTKVILEWDLNATSVFDENQIERLKSGLKTFLTKDEVIQISSGETRSQHTNKEIVTQRLIEKIEAALKPVKKRKKTKPGKKFHENRLTEKKRIAEKKANRKDPFR